jgi:hypothetical protein
VNLEKWQADDSYYEIRLDLQLLSEDLLAVTDDELLRCRYVLERPVSDLSDRALGTAVRDCIEHGRALTTEVEVKNPEGVSDVAGYIHDCWFDLSGVDHDPVGERLTIPFRCGIRDRTRRLLTFRHVRDVRSKTPSRSGPTTSTSSPTSPGLHASA